MNESTIARYIVGNVDVILCGLVVVAWLITVCSGSFQNVKDRVR